jgi:hypothetical protein
MIVLARRSVLGTTAAVVCAAAFTAPSTALAVTVDTEIGDGIGTSVPDVFGDGSNATVNTSISSVTYEEPVLVKRDGVRYYEVLGTVEEVGWGGEFQDLEAPGPAEPFAAFAHYSYSMPFVLRWAVGWDGTLVHYQHGYSALDLSVLFDEFLGNDNEARRFDIAEGGYVSDVVVDKKRKHAFFAINLSGLDRNGERWCRSPTSASTGRISAATSRASTTRSRIFRARACTTRRSAMTWSSPKRSCRSSAASASRLATPQNWQPSRSRHTRYHILYV